MTDTLITAVDELTRALDRDRAAPSDRLAAAHRRLATLLAGPSPLDQRRLLALTPQALLDLARHTTFRLRTQARLTYHAPREATP